MEKVKVAVDPKTLDLIMSPQALQEIIDGQRKEAFAEGMKTAIKNKPQAATKFDPEKHVDNSLYGYTTIEGLSHLNNGDGKVIFARRPEGMGKPVFCKITPLKKEVKHD